MVQHQRSSLSSQIVDGPCTTQVDRNISKMKFGIILIASTLVAFSAAFSVVERSRSSTRISTRQSMFTGAGDGAAESPEEAKKLEEAAKAMGMSVDEYKLGMNARVRLTETMSSARITGGDPGKVSVERDAHNPPQFLEVTITEDGKGLGKDEVSKQLVAALKSTSEEAKTKRAEAQKDMMTYISEQMKKVGK